MLVATWPCKIYLYWLLTYYFNITTIMLWCGVFVLTEIIPRFFQSSSWSASPWRDHKFASLHARSAMLRRKCGNANWQGASARTTRSSLIEYRPGSLARTMARECRPICKICIYNQYRIVVSWSLFLNTSLESCTGWCSGSYRWVWWYVWVLQLFTIVRKSFHNLLRILWQSLRIVLKSLRIFVKILKDFRENP